MVGLTMAWFSEKMLIFMIYAKMVRCPTWKKNLGRYLINSANAVFTLHTDEILTIKVVRPPPDATTYTDYLRAHDVTIHRQPIEVSIALFFKRILEIFRFYLRPGLGMFNCLYYKIIKLCKSAYYEIKEICVCMQINLN